MLQRIARGSALPIARIHQLWSLPAGLLDTAALAVDLWAERARQRQQLGELGDYALKDLGLTRSDVVRESSKWFWQR